MNLKKGSNHKYGYVDSKTKEWVIQPMYEEASEFNYCSVAAVAVSEGRNIIINKDNKNVTGKIYSHIEVMRDGYMKAKEIDTSDSSNNFTYAFLKPNGQEIVELRGVYVIDITSNGVVEFTYRDRYGVYNLKTGKKIEAKYYRIFNFSDDRGSIDYAVVYNNEDKAGIIDWDDKIIISFEYTELVPYKRFGVVIAKKDNFYGVLDFDGNEIHPFEFSSYSVEDSKIKLKKIITTTIG